MFYLKWVASIYAIISLVMTTFIMFKIEKSLRRMAGADALLFAFLFILLTWPFMLQEIKKINKYGIGP